jgi:photosystem II stability/assembly factor-like uncharacterized protein
LFKQLKYRHIGPEGNRVSAVAGVIGDPNVYYAGAASGGIFKSTDAGKTWVRSGLDSTGRIGRIVVHPTNPDMVYASAVVRSYGPQQQRGVYRTTDGG